MIKKTLYIVFLRGVNVGGHNLLKMEEICQIFSSLGFKNVSSYKQTGNILFESNSNPNTIAKKVQKELNKLIGKNVEIFLQTSSQIKEIYEKYPFKEVKSDPVKMFVTFVHHPLKNLNLPLKSPNLDVEIILTKDCVLFSKAYMKKGRFGVPNSFIETKFKVPATTRNWNTIKGIAEAINPNHIRIK